MRFSKSNKYRAKPVYECVRCSCIQPKPEDGICVARCGSKQFNFFASKGEHQRWRELILLQKAGHIERLERQVRYPLKVNDVLVATFVPDFRYYASGRGTVIEDWKGGGRTEAWNVRRKLFEAIYRLPVVESGAR